MKTSSRSILTATLVLGVSHVALAQPADPTAGAPVAPADPATPPAQPTPPTTPTPPVEPTPPTATAPAEALPPVPEKPVEPKKDEKPTVSAKYDGGLKFESSDDKYELKLSFRNQMRFEATRPLDEETPTKHNQFADKFYIPRSRLQAEGYVFGKENRYKVEFGFGDSGSFAFLKDMFMERKVADKVYLRAGQWKRPFNRQELVSDFASTFNERSIQNELAGGGRDMGVALHNDYEKSPEGVEWVAGVFNGFSGGADRPAISTSCAPNMAGALQCTNTRPTTFKADFGPTLVARVGYNSPKIKGYSESDLEGGPLRYAVGLAYKVDLANFSKGAQPSWSDNLSHGLEADAMIKAEGFSAHLGVVMMNLKNEKSDYGIHIQPGYMVVPKKIEVAGRFAWATEKAKDRNQIEGRAAFNYYMHGHSWKLASDVGFLQYTGTGANNDKPDLQIRIMGQMQI